MKSALASVDTHQCYIYQMAPNFQSWLYLEEQMKSIYLNDIIQLKFIIEMQYLILPSLFLSMEKQMQKTLATS